MNNVPANLRYTKSHEWVRDDHGVLTVGITDHAQDLMGDMVFVDLPKVGDALTAGKECAVVESVKAASDVYAPLDGTVTEINGDLGAKPEAINSDPYGAGWLFKFKPASAVAAAGLLDATAYENLLAAEG
ncbi:MAG: glycine cleavage system protein GcvH [Gammaproteobacteria bacterium]|nr:glycine cleavage system protein GcvH [Gammaproteobacteria bacterium]